MDAFSELKGLADQSDSFINRTKNHNRRLKEWFNLFKREVEDIVFNQNISTETTDSNNTSTSQHKLPEIVSFVCETEKAATSNLRVSSALACLKKDHILHVKRNTRLLTASPRKTRSKTPGRNGPNNFNSTFVKFNGETPLNNVETPINNGEAAMNNIETPMNNANDETDGSMNGDEKQDEFYTPVGQNPELAGMQTMDGGRTSRKRKSSSPLPSTANVKKVKAVNSETVSVQKSIRKSLRGQHGKLSESKFFKYHNRVPSSKVSVTGAKISGVNSVLKENRTSRMKNEVEDNQAMKKVLAARQLKAQEAKRKREEKMQKISQQRLKLEKEKDERLRSRKPKEVEKPLLKTVLDSKKKRPREVEKNHNSEGPTDSHSTKKVRGTETDTPVKTPRKKATEKLAQKENRNEKAQQAEKVTKSQAKNIHHSTQETNQTGTPAKTPRKKTAATLKEDVNKNDKVEMNKTYNANPYNTKETVSSSSKATSPVKEVFKTPVAPQRTTPAMNGTTTTTKPTASPLTSKQKQQSLHVTGNSQSYEMTPARESFVNYDISEIKSDDSDDDDDGRRNVKPVPGWAGGIRLKNALIQQQYRSIDTDLIFGNTFATPDLEKMMGVKSKRYFKRTSSAVWNSPSAFL